MYIVHRLYVLGHIFTNCPGRRWSRKSSRMESWRSCRSFTSLPTHAPRQRRRRRHVELTQVTGGFLWGYPVFHPWMTSLVLKAMVNLGSPRFQENLQMTFSKKLVSRKTDVFRRFPKSPGCDSHHFPIFPMKLAINCEYPPFLGQAQIYPQCVIIVSTCFNIGPSNVRVNIWG